MFENKGTEENIVFGPMTGEEQYKWKYELCQYTRISNFPAPSSTPETK
jgi:hypothetical protein